MKGLKYLTFETNGTQKLTDEFKGFLRSYILFTEVTFSVSAKLSPSGEKWEDAIKPEIVADYADIGDVYLKFVVDKETDIEEIDRAVKAYYDARDISRRFYDVYLMPVGGTDQLYFNNFKAVAEMAMKRGWKYSPRLQVDIWRNQWGT
jgi:organic radical activating enzyme